MNIILLRNGTSHEDNFPKHIEPVCFTDQCTIWPNYVEYKCCYKNAVHFESITEAQTNCNSVRVISVERGIETRPLAGSVVITILFNVALVTLLWRVIILENTKKNWEWKNLKYNINDHKICLTKSVDPMSSS